MRRVATRLLVFWLVSASVVWAQVVWPEPRPLVTPRLARAGIRVVEAPHLTLVTDLPPSPDVDELPRVVAATLPRWAERFGVPIDGLRDWRLRAYLMRDRERFDALGLVPAEAGPFPDGWAYGHEAWVVEQPSAYYRRHLLLHEGTHSFMMTELGGCGPAWFMEGMAELLGTHSWDVETERLELGVMPASKKLTPYWGRIKRVRLAEAPRPIASIMKLNNARPLPTEAYAWVWALAKFLDTHPAYRERFRELHRHVLKEDFNQRFRKAYQQDAEQLVAEWRLFAATAEYGHDIGREAIDFDAPTGPLSTKPKTVVVRADRGWQPAGVVVKRGDRVGFTPAGRFTIAREPDGQGLPNGLPNNGAWPCEANGVTLRYHGGRPLGVLLVAVGDRGLVEPIVVGSGGGFTMPRDGAMLLRVNDSPAELAENEGTLSVTIAAE